MDVYGKATRSYVMSRIRKTDSGPEVKLRRALWALGVRGYRLRAKLPGTPDLVISRAKLTVFVDGCFWHGCPRCAIPRPRTNRGYWHPKIDRNMARDKRVTRELRGLGWGVIRIWEHEVTRDAERCARRVEKKLGEREAVR